MKHNEEFADFLRDHVNLNQSRIDALEEHISAVTTYMKTITTVSARRTNKARTPWEP